ncbi:MAG: PKD domain-containing protein [Acidimicrobiales bacterium]
MQSHELVPVRGRACRSTIYAVVLALLATLVQVPLSTPPAGADHHLPDLDLTDPLPVPPSPVFAPNAPIPQCETWEGSTGNTVYGLGCQRPITGSLASGNVGVGVSGVAHAGGSVTVDASPPGSLCPPGQSDWFAGCNRLGDIRITACIFVIDSDPLNLDIPCGRGNGMPDANASVPPYLPAGVERTCDEHYTSCTFHFPESPDGGQWTNLYGPTFYKVEATFRQCVEWGESLFCEHQVQGFGWMPVQGHLGPRADFDVVEVEPGVIQFVNQTSPYRQGETYYRWAVPGQLLSTETHPRVTFPEPGYYDVTLIVRNQPGAGSRTCGPPCEVTKTIPVGILGPPTAAFDVAMSDQIPGLAQFTSFATDPADGPLAHSWDFGDGYVSGSTDPEHQYELPGTYPVTLTVTTPDDRSDTVTQLVEVPAPDVDATLELGDGRDPAEPFSVGEQVELRLSLAASHGVGDTSLSFDPGLDDWLDELEVFEVTSSPEVVPAGISPNQSIEVSWELTARRAGTFELGTTLVTTDAAGVPTGPLALGVAGEVRGALLGVEFIVPEEPIRLEVSTDASDAPEGDEDGIVFDPHFFAVDVRVTIPDDVEEVRDLRLVPIDEDGGVIEIVSVTRSGDTWEQAELQPDPIGVTVEDGPDPEAFDGPLDAGDEVTFEFILKAEQPGTVRLSVQAEADLDEGVAEGEGSVILPVTAPILAVEMWVNEDDHGAPGPSLVEGDSLLVQGWVENLSPTDTIQLFPVHVESEGQGLVRGPVTAGYPIPEPGEFGIFDPELGPGERADFYLQVDTVVLEGVNSDYLIGRESIVLETYMSGVVIDDAGTERDLDGTTEVIFDVGNGRHVIDGRTLIRAEVDPRWRDREEYQFIDLVEAIGGMTLRRMLSGSANAFIQMPEMIMALPGAVWSFEMALNDLEQDRVETYMASVEYLWAWLDYHLAIHLDLDPATEAAILAEVTADVEAKFGHMYDSHAQVVHAVDEAVQGFYTRVAEHHERAIHSANYGSYQQVADDITAWVEPAAGFATEELTGHILTSWFSRLARSPQVADDLAEGAVRRAQDGRVDVANATDEVWQAGRDPRTTQAPPSMRTLTDTVPVSPTQAIRGWAIDGMSDANLRRMTSRSEGLPIIVAIRSRADETLQWMTTQLGITVKPVTLKPKNADWRDEQFLGYRGGVGYGVGDRGSVVLVEPLSRDEVIRRLEVANADDFTRSTVLDRHNQRWKEWYGVECNPSCVVPSDYSGSTVSRLKAQANVQIIDPDTGLVTRRGSLEVPSRGRVPEPADNWDTSGAPTIYDNRRFEMRQIADPEGLGREYFEVWLEHADGSMRRVAGDIDIVAVTDTSGKVLSGSSAENVAQQLGHAVEAQHPWSATLSNPELRDQFLNAHRWPDGEPLLIYTNGEARVGWFDPTKSINVDSPLDSVIWLKGGGGDVDSVVRYQRDLRGTVDNPMDAPSPRGHVPAESTVRKALIDADNLDGGNRTATCSVPVGARGSIFRLGDAGGLERRGEDGAFTAVDVDEACQGGEIVVLPDTAILEDVAAGTRTLPIIDELLDYDWRSLFATGLCVIIAPGTDVEEEACIEDHGSLVLDRPLQHDHDAMTVVVLLLEDDPPDDGGTSVPGGPDTDTDGGTRGDGAPPIAHGSEDRSGGLDRTEATLDDQAGADALARGSLPRTGSSAATRAGLVALVLLGMGILATRIAIRRGDVGSGTAGLR